MISKMQRTTIDTLTYDHLTCAESGDTIFAFSRLPKSHVCYKKALRLFSVSKRLRIGGQSDKGDLIVEVCEDCFRVVEIVEIKEVKEFQKMLLAEYACQVMSCNRKYGV